jgi:hypothetical protein
VRQLKLALIPLEAADAGTCSRMGELLAQWAGLRIALWEPVPFSDLLNDQQLTDAVVVDALVHGIAALATNTVPLLGITDRDLQDCRGNPVSGAAQRGGRAGVVSYHQRCDWVALFAWHGLHEAGHLFGLDHCGAAGCVMQYHRWLQPLINSAAPFCAACMAQWGLLSEDVPGIGGHNGTAGPVDHK